MKQENIILLIFVLSIIFNAIADGLRFRDLKNPNTLTGQLYHLFWGVTIATLLCLMTVHVRSSAEIFKYIIAYGFIRFGLFDFIHNATARKHLLYIGNTATFDIILNRYFGSATAKGVLMAIRVAFLITGMFLIQYFNEYF